MDVPSPCQPVQPDAPAMPPRQIPDAPAMPPRQIPDAPRLLAARLFSATTPAVGSLPERFSWQPFHAHHAAPFSPPHAEGSGSLGNPFVPIGAQERARPYPYAPQRPPMHQQPYYACSSSAQANFQPVFVPPHSHGRPWEPHSVPISPTLTQCIHQPVTSCCSQPSCLAAQSFCVAKCSTRPDITDSRQADPGHCDEKTPLLVNCPSKQGRSGHGGADAATAEESCGMRGSRGERAGCQRFHSKQMVALSAMLAVLIASFASLSVMAPFFPHEADRLNLEETTNGIIFSIYPCVIFITSPIIGKLLPLFESRCVFLVGVILTGLANILFGMVSHIYKADIFVAVTIGLRFLAALGTSCFLTVIYAIIPIVFPENVNMVNGMIETSIGLGMCLGPAVGMWLYGMGGFPLPFIGLGAFILLAAIINCFSFPDDELEIVNHGTGAVWSVLARPRSILSLLILCVTAVCAATLYPTLQPHMHELGVSTEGVCVVYLVLSAVYAVAAPLVGLATDRFGGLDKFMLAGLVLTALSFILIGNSPLLPPAPSHNELYMQDIAGMVVFGVSSAMCIVPTYASILKAASSTMEVDLGTYSVIGGLWSSAYSLGEMLGPLYAGLLAEHISFASTTTVTALLPATLAVMFGAYMCGNRHRGPPPPPRRPPPPPRPSQEDI
ncbi:MFS-type transporter SLC18B1-like [Eriocheir sinensis]|uniref:MFS-type transporter SLC18B1-like n=1 Tax=Eriocheir sinensis TaxID=95602 RepID=UPI0021C7DFC0|nr:MFS-type transporter SLC18B1-like [Eriocheir sinensis]